MFSRLARFVTDESAAVSLDWIVLGAFSAGLALLAVGTVRNSSVQLGAEVDAAVVVAEIGATGN